jgi:dipeptidyl-peptidase-4
MAAYALTHSKMFKVGIAHSGVYDWRLYDTIYTERYMAKPQNNKKGYRVSSVVRAARNLHGHLIIVHGALDDNVHMQNALQLVHALQNANKQNFTLMIYPKAKHGIRNPHWTELRRRIVKEHL